MGSAGWTKSLEVVDETLLTTKPKNAAGDQDSPTAPAQPESLPLSFSQFPSGSAAGQLSPKKSPSDRIRASV